MIPLFSIDHILKNKKVIQSEPEIPISQSNGISSGRLGKMKRNLNFAPNFSISKVLKLNFEEKDANNSEVKFSCDYMDEEQRYSKLSESEEDSTSDNTTKSSPPRQKKTRTVFSRAQVYQLETVFDIKRYPSSSERGSLARLLLLSDTQVKIWFQNRRNKWKRQLAFDIEAANRAYQLSKKEQSALYPINSTSLVNDNLPRSSVSDPCYSALGQMCSGLNRPSTLLSQFMNSCPTMLFSDSYLFRF